MAASGTRSSVHPLTRLSSQDDYIIVDRQASQVLRAAKRIERPRSPNRRVLHELYYGTKHKAKVLYGQRKVLREHAASVTIVQAATGPIDPYDTTDWEDGHDPANKEDLINTKHAVDPCRGELSGYYPGGSKFDILKFRIVTYTDHNGRPVNDYFMKVEIDAPSANIIFVQVSVSQDYNCMPRAVLVKDYLKPRPPFL